MADILTEVSPRELTANAFAAWSAGTGYFTDLLADDVRWTIAGNSLASKTYNSKQAFVDDVLAPFGRRFRTPFRPVAVRGLYAEGDTAIILWDGEGIALDGEPYVNTYAWFLTFRDGLVIEATAFYDAIAFDDLWRRVEPAAS